MNAVELTGDERKGLLEIIDRGLDAISDYQTYGNPHTDYGAEWPEIARGTAGHLDNAALACRKLGADEMAEGCEARAKDLRAGAIQFEAEAK